MQDSTPVSSPSYASGTLIRKAILEVGQLRSTLKELHERSVMTTRTWDPALKALRDQLSELRSVGLEFLSADTTVPTKSTGTPRSVTKKSDESNTDAAKDILKMTASEPIWTPSGRPTPVHGGEETSSRSRQMAQHSLQSHREDYHLKRTSNKLWLHTCQNCGSVDIDGNCSWPCTACGRTCDGQRASLPQADGDDRDASELD